MDGKQKMATFKEKLLGEKLNKATLWFAFCLYLFLLIWFIGLKYNSDWLPKLSVDMRKMPLWNRGKFIPFYDQYGDFFYFDHFCVMNIFIYMPMGIYTMFIFREKSWACILFAFVSSVIFEVEHLLTGFGGCESSDVVCNTIGGVLGVALYLLTRAKISDKAVNIVNFCVIIIATPFALFALINTIIHWQYYVIV